MKGIIIEGPNGSGKSTLAEMLSCKYEIMHAGPDDKSVKTTIKSIFVQLKHLNKGGVLDRCTPVSKQIYQKNVTALGHFLLNAIYKIFYERHIIVYCTGNGDFTDKKYYEKNHYEKIVKNREKIRCKYNKFFYSRKCIKYNFNGK